MNTVQLRLSQSKFRRCVEELGQPQQSLAELLNGTERSRICFSDPRNVKTSKVHLFVEAEYRLPDDEELAGKKGNLDAQRVAARLRLEHEIQKEAQLILNLNFGRNHVGKISIVRLSRKHGEKKSYSQTSLSTLIRDQ